jgi:predicted nucleic acid-binding protein
VSAAAVSDTGPLIHLAEIDSLELLSTFNTLFVPETVYKEVEAAIRIRSPEREVQRQCHQFASRGIAQGHPTHSGHAARSSADPHNLRRTC